MNLFFMSNLPTKRVVVRVFFSRFSEENLHAPENFMHAQSMWDKCMHDSIMRGISARGTDCVSNIHMTHSTDMVQHISKYFIKVTKLV